MGTGFMCKLKELMGKCKCGVYVSVNEHRDLYISAEDRIKELDCSECPPEISDDVRKNMIDTDTIVYIQFYPDTPIGSYDVYHYDIDAAIDEALECASPSCERL